MAKFKILITGASGYLGQHFLNTLMKKDEIGSSYSIFAMYQKKPLNIPNDKSSIIQTHKIDFTDQTAVDSFFEFNGPFDLCFHLAALASPKLCEEDPFLAMKINVPVPLLEKLKDTNIVALSTDQVYCGDNPVYSEDTAKPSPKNVYSKSKLALESYLCGSDNHRTKPAICLRSSIILGKLGPFGGAHSTFLHFVESRNNVAEETTFYTDEVRSVIWVEDVINVLLYFMDAFYQEEEQELSRENNQIYNMGGPENISRMEMAVAVAKVCEFSSENFVALKKADLPSDHPARKIPSPLDISMDSSKLEKLVGRKFLGLESIVKETFL